jgi:hypothetical protein
MYALPSLSYNAPIRIVATDKLEVNVAVAAAGTYYVRATIGIGSLTIPEKIKWGIPLSTEERKIAEQEDLYDKVEAGLA